MARRRAAAAILTAVALLPPPAAGAEVVVAASGRTDLVACSGEHARLIGDTNRLVFHDACRSLRVEGRDNIVEIELLPGAAIWVIGDNNHVIYAPVDPPPSVAVQGRDDKVEAGPAGPASAALAPDIPEAPPAPAVIPPPEVAPRPQPR